MMTRDPAGIPVQTPAADVLAELPGDEAVHRHRLPVRTLTYWRVRALLGGLVAVGVLVWAAVGLTWFDLTLRWAAVAGGVVWFLVIGVLVRPVVRWRLFWYAITDDEIDLQHGWLVQSRTVVPMNRVQHLESEQGVLASRFRLAVLHIHTAAGAIVVAGLDQEDAALMRTRIGRLAHLADDL